MQSLHLGLADGLVVSGPVPPFAGYDYGVILRRELLDDALLEFVLARHPDTITLYDGTNVDDLLRDGERIRGVLIRSNDWPVKAMELRAPLVIGADGRFSRVARLVGAGTYNTRQSYTTLFYSYVRWTCAVCAT